MNLSCYCGQRVPRQTLTMVKVFVTSLEQDAQEAAPRRLTKSSELVSLRIWICAMVACVVGEHYFFQAWRLERNIVGEW